MSITLNRKSSPQAVTRRYRARQQVLFDGAERLVGEVFEISYEPPRGAFLDADGNAWTQDHPSGDARRIGRTILDDCDDAVDRGIIEPVGSDTPVFRPVPPAAPEPVGFRISPPDGMVPAGLAERLVAALLLDLSGEVLRDLSPRVLRVLTDAGLGEAIYEEASTA